MRTACLFALSALLLPAVSTSVVAQDEPPDPTLAAPADATSDTEEIAPSNEPEVDASAVPAEEEAPVDDGKKPISVALLVGYGLVLDDGSPTDGGPNPWGLGFGLRGGYNLDKVFLGARFVYYLGESVDTVGTFGGATDEVSLNVWELGVEVGYDFELSSSVVVRPGLGLGVASSTVSFNGFSESSTDLYFAPGASLLFDVSPTVFLGLDVRLQFVLGDNTAIGLPILATGGMRF